MPFIYHFIYLVLTSALAGAKICSGHHGSSEGKAHVSGHHISARHAHYSYHPPNQIIFICRHCASPAVYPVYHGAPPSYVYVYRESGTRYSGLLTGLALYNLGRCCGSHHDANVYTPLRNEKCSLQIIDRSHFEETKFPCFMMSSFMENSNKTNMEILSQTKHNETEVQKSVSFDILASHINVKPFLSGNRSELEVRRDQECVIWHNLTLNKERHTVPCSLLEQYAETMKPGVHVYIWMSILFGTIVGIYVFYYCFCRKNPRKEDAPLNQTTVPGYCSNY